MMKDLMYACKQRRQLKYQLFCDSASGGIMAVRCQLLNTCLRKDFAALKSFIT